MRYSVCVSLVLGIGLAALSGAASAQSDPPARVGRLAYVQGTVSFHDAQQDAWSPAASNMPITTGDSLWIEPNGHDEIQIAGTRLRMDGNTQLDVLALDDSQTRLQLDRGRLDVRAFSLDSPPYQILTPRGTVTLEQAGDYYVHAGTADDPTVLGVRTGAAQIQTPNGQVLAVRAGEEGEAIGSDNTLQLRTVRSTPPPMPAYWAERDREISYAPPQYVSADVTGYADLASYGSWTVDPDYGEVWYPAAVPVGWRPYSTGYWTYVAPWGWTWVDAQPWGFAPYHYGRWAFRGERWCWIPPQRAERPVYAPALVGFVGGTELGISIGLQSRAPVGWFPLGPHEPYVPPYVVDRDYYRRLNMADRVQEAELNDRWLRAERHEAYRANDPHESWMNRRFATVVPAEDFAHSRPVQQVALKVPADKLAQAPVAPVAAPPAPNRPIATTQQTSAHGSANIEQIGRPTTAVQPRQASGPRIAEHTTGSNGRSALPPLPSHSGEQQHQVPPANRVEPSRPEASHAAPPHEEKRTEPQRPVEPQRSEPQHPVAPHTPAVEQPHAASPHAEPPHEEKRSEPQRPAEPQRSEPPRVPQHPTENHALPSTPQPVHHADAPHVQPQHVAPPQQAQAPHPAPPPQHVAPPPQQAQAPHPAPQGGHEQKK